MSGTPTGRAPRSDAEWVRNTEARIRVLEQTPTVRVGSWTLLDQGGSLVAAQPGATPVPLDGSNLDARIADATSGLATGSTVKALDARLTDITSVLGVVGLGTGNPAIPGIENIPLLGPVLVALESLPVIGQVVEAITGVAGQGLAFLTAFFADLLGILGNPADLGTGNPIIDAVENIPLLGGIIVESVQGLTDLLYNFITGGFGSGNTLDDLRGVIPGVALVPFVGDQISSTVDAVAIGLGRLLGGNFSFGTLSNVARQTANTIDGNVSITETHSLHLAQRAVTKPGFLAIDPTSDPTFPIQPGATPTFLNLVASTSIIGFISIPDPGPKTAIRWCGKTITNITSFILRLYKLDPATGALTWLHTSANIIAYVAPDIDVWNSYNFPSIVTAQGDWYAVEAIIVGSGTYQLYGEPYWAPPHPSLYPSQLGGSRPVSDIASFAAWGGTTTILSGSWSETISTRAKSTYIFLDIVGTAGNTVTGVTATVGGKAASLLETPYQYRSTTTPAWLAVLVCRDPPTGAQTIAWSSTGSGNKFVTGISVSVPRATGEGTPAHTALNTAAGTAMTQSATGAAGQLLLQAFTYSAGAGTITNYNQTSAAYAPGVNGQHNPLLVGFAIGTGSPTTFTATGSVSEYWGGIAIPITRSPELTDLALADYGYSSNVPFFALSGVAAAMHHIDKVDYWEVAGTERFTPYDWADTADLVGVGAGGGGGAGQFGPGTDGTATTFLVHYTDATPDLTVTAAGGAGGTPGWLMYNAAIATGLSPGNRTLNGEEYFGGGEVSAANAGDSPGGGGGGGVVQVLLSWEYGAGAAPGQWASSLNLPLANVEYIDVTVGTHGVSGPTTPGGPGADGGAWIRSYQA